MERGRVAVGELARYRAALEAGDQAVIDQITAKFDPSKPEGEEFLREYFAYFGYGYLDTPQQIVPNVPLLFYSFRVMVGAGASSSCCWASSGGSTARINWRTGAGCCGSPYGRSRWPTSLRRPAGCWPRSDASRGPSRI